MTKAEAIEAVRRYLPPDLAEAVIAALDDVELRALLEDRAMMPETPDTAIKHLAGPVSHLAQHFQGDHVQHPAESE